MESTGKYDESKSCIMRFFIGIGALLPGVILFIVLMVVCAVLAPRLVARLMAMSRIADSAGMELFLYTIYTGCVPAAGLLISLHLLLRRIISGDVFVNENTACLRYMSWCCYSGAVICLVSALYYLPWVTIGIAAAFMGLVMRVIKNVFAKAISLQDDVELTI